MKIVEVLAWKYDVNQGTVTWTPVRVTETSSPREVTAERLEEEVAKAEAWCENELIGEPNRPLKIVVTKTVYRSHQDGPR